MMHRIIIFLIHIIDVVLSDGSRSLISLPFSHTCRLEFDFNRSRHQPFSFTDPTDNQQDLSSSAKLQYAELRVSRQASFISYSSEFTSIIDYAATLQLLEAKSVGESFAHEGGTYVPETNEAWFTADQVPTTNTNISSVNLKTDTIQLLSIQPPILTPNGLQYFEGLVYICSQGNQKKYGGIYSVNPTTLVTRLVVNSWFGLRLNSPNDLAFTTKIAGRKYMWFTDPQVAYMQNFGVSPQLGSFVYRFDLTTSELRPVITDLIIPNGIAFDPNETTLYISDTAPSSFGQETHVVYAYDFSHDALPINRRVFSVSSLGIPDGIKVDRVGRVWTAEGDGINVRNRYGSLLGVILGRNLCATGVISNFGLINDTVIILAQEKLWRLKLDAFVT